MCHVFSTCYPYREDDSKSSNHDRKSQSHVKHVEGAISVKDEPLDKVYKLWWLWPATSHGRWGKRFTRLEIIFFTHYTVTRSVWLNK